MPYGRWVLHLKLEPKLSQPKAKAAIHDIWQAETKVDAEKAFDLLIKTYDPKYPACNAEFCCNLARRRSGDCC
jgi:hypothetical protein